MRFLKDIVKEDIVDKIDKTFNVTRVELAEVLVSKLFVCDVKFLQVGDGILDDENREAVITSVGSNFITIRKGTSFTWTSNKFTVIKDFYFIAGTPLDVDAEWLKRSIVQTSKLPLFWLALPTNETINSNGQGLERESVIRLFVIEQSMLKYTVDEYYSEVMKYLMAYLEAFKDAIKKNKLFANIESFDQRELYRLGSESQDGFEALIIDSNLSAIEIRFTLPIRKGAKCLC